MTVIDLSKSVKSCLAQRARPDFDCFYNGVGTAPLHATLHARYEATLTEKNRAARSHGFEIARTYETPQGKPLAAGAVQLGSLVRVRLAVKTGEQRNYVAIEDKLPAGLEPLNAELATTERVSQGPLSEGLKRGLQRLSYSELRDARVAFFVQPASPARRGHLAIAPLT